MGDTTAISWTDRTFNGWMGCFKISPGCKHCYAETLSKNRMGLDLWGPASNTTRQVTSLANWAKPFRWDREAQHEGRRLKVFCGSMCDWAEDHPVANDTRPRLWELIRQTPNLDWQLLTKRPERIAELLPYDWGEGYPNVWLGTSIENQDYAWRADELRRIPAVVRFISYEPALGSLKLDLSGISWMIYGGESGPSFRLHNLSWPRAMRDACKEAGTAFYYKQGAAMRPGQLTSLDGEVHHAYPSVKTAHRPLQEVAIAQAALS